jgi:hypothetical protein
MGRGIFLILIIAVFSSGAIGCNSSPSSSINGPATPDQKTSKTEQRKKVKVTVYVTDSANNSISDVHIMLEPLFKLKKTLPEIGWKTNKEGWVILHLEPGSYLISVTVAGKKQERKVKVKDETRLHFETN